MTKARDIASAIPAPSTVSSAELGYLDGVTSAIQTQIDSKIGSASAINPTIVDAKGDIIAATAADTVARLAVGANGTVLTAASGQATGLEWATPASVGATLLTTTTLSGTSTTVSSISQSYTNLFIEIDGANTATGQAVTWLRFNGISTSTYDGTTLNIGATANWVNSSNTTEFASDVYTNSGANNNVIQIQIPNYTSSQLKRFSWYGSAIAFNQNIIGYGRMDSFTSAITSFTVLNDSGYTFNGGTIKIYGVNI